MVSSSQGANSRRARRHSYAERVLNAVSDIHIRSRKNSVHINSLTAQVRKNAVHQDDHLGPHWKSWVKIACGQLASNNILESPPTHGHIMLTREGKKRLTDVQKYHTLSRNHRHTPHCSEISAWRSVVKQSDVSGGRTFSRGSSRSENRTDRTFARMTKAQLITEIKKLQKAFEDLSITHKRMEEQKNEEIRKLNEILEAQDDKWLEENDNLLEPEDNDREIGDETLVDFDTDVFNADILKVPSSERHNKNASHLRPPPVHTLSRTISGSFISNISKQATPAPSDIDSECGSQIYIDFPLEDPSNPDQSYFHNSNNETGVVHLDYPAAPTTKQLSLQTPSATPEPLEDEGGQQKKVERLGEERDEAKRELEKKESDLAFLRNRCSALDRDSRILRTNETKLEEQLAEQKVELERLSNALQEKVIELEDVSTSSALQSSIGNEIRLKYERELQVTRRLVNALAISDEKLESLSSSYDLLQSSFQEVEYAKETLLIKYNDLSAEFEKEKEIFNNLEHELLGKLSLAGKESDDSQAAPRKTQDILQKTLTQLSLERQTRENLEGDLSALRFSREMEVSAMRTELTKVSDELKDKHRETETLRCSELSLHSSLHHSMEEVGSLAKDVERLQAEFTLLENDIRNKSSDLLSTTTELELMKQQMYVVKRNEDDLKARLKRIECEKEELSIRLSYAESRAGEFECCLDDMMKLQRQQCEEIEKRMSKKRKYDTCQAP